MASDESDIPIDVVGSQQNATDNVISLNDFVQHAGGNVTSLENQIEIYL